MITEIKNEQISRQKLSEQVFDRLREMIVSGELVPGDVMLSERALMEKFGVGRPAVREALQTMANKGLITISHGERSRVNELNAGVAFEQIDDIAKLLLSVEPSNLEHLTQVRKLVEFGTVRLAAQKCTGEDIIDLRKLNNNQRTKIDNSKAFIQADISFHMRIAEITGNPILHAITQAMLTWIFQYNRPLLLWSGHEEKTLLEHEKLINVLEKQDADGSVIAMREHLNRAENLYSNSKP